MTDKEDAWWEQELDDYQQESAQRMQTSAFKEAGPVKRSPTKPPLKFPSSRTNTSGLDSRPPVDLLASVLRGSNAPKTPALASNSSASVSISVSGYKQDYEEEPYEEEPNNKSSTLSVKDNTSPATRMASRYSGLPQQVQSGAESQQRRASVENPTDLLIESPEQAINAISGMVNELSRLTGLAFVSDEAKRRLAEVQKDLEGVSVLIEEDEKKGQVSDVQALLNFKHLPWSFENENVYAYRARALRFPHRKYTVGDVRMPRFFSRTQLPAEISEAFKCTVSLRDLATSLDESQDQLNILFRADDDAIVIIAKVMQVVKERTGRDLNPADPEKWTLKAIGYNDFLYGREALLTYSYVRDQIRTYKVSRFKLVKLVQDESETSAKTLQEAERYEELISKNSYPVLLKDHYTKWPPQWHNLTFLPIREVKVPFRVVLRGIDYLTPQSLPRFESTMTQCKVKSFLFHGHNIIRNSTSESQTIPLTSSVRWNQLLHGATSPGISISCLPRETRIACVVYGVREIGGKDAEEILAYLALPLIDEVGVLLAGDRTFKMWPVETGLKPRHLTELSFILSGGCIENRSRRQGVLNNVSISLSFDEFALPVGAPLIERYRDPDISRIGVQVEWNKLPKSMRNDVQRLITCDPLYKLTADDKQMLWSTRHHLTKHPLALPKFLQSVDWADADHRNEAHRLLNSWTPPPNPVSAIDLLDARFADTTVREYAINCLRVLPDDELNLFLLQLAQCLKHEPYHDSTLTRFLIERSLRSPLVIGHTLFWHLKAELHDPLYCERFGLILEEYLTYCGAQAARHRNQHDIVQKLQRLSGMVVQMKRAKEKSDDEILEDLQAGLQKLNEEYLENRTTLQVPLNARWEAASLRVEKCRYMSSKMAPLWLVFNNADPEGEDIYVIFKSGDDLRQDILTLQLLKVMDKIWLSESVDLRMEPYRCVATGVNALGKGVGMIEVVKKSDTTSGIQLKYGGGALGALKLEPLQKFIEDFNPPDVYETAVDNFVRSCAGYCVATYLLGIGDRHNGNIMMKQDGHLFHIDFGHFLGNFKSKFGVKRERAAFVLTPEMGYVMGGKKFRKSKNFRRFIDYCENGFSILRQYAPLFITLFRLMVAAHMPELLFDDDINYLRDKFGLQDSDKGAREQLRKEINKSLNTSFRSFDNLIHNWKHG